MHRQRCSDLPQWEAAGMAGDYHQSTALPQRGSLQTGSLTELSEYELRFLHCSQQTCLKIVVLKVQH